jgi:hypothetical protein
MRNVLTKPWRSMGWRSALRSCPHRCSKPSRCCESFQIGQIVPPQHRTPPHARSSVRSQRSARLMRTAISSRTQCLPSEPAMTLSLSLSRPAAPSPLASERAPVLSSRHRPAIAPTPSPLLLSPRFPLLPGVSPRLHTPHTPCHCSHSATTTARSL